MTTLTETQIPFRYDVVGSLLRPAPLKQARAEFAQGAIDAEQLKQVQRAETKRVVQKQIDLGLKAVTDGEFNRSWWHLDFLWGLTGVGHYDYQQSYKFHGSKTRTDNADLVGKVAFNPNHPFFESFQYLQSLVPAGVLVKQTIPSPTMLFRDNRSDNWHEFYPTWDAYLDDLAKAYHETILHFYELGCRYLQLDDTTWAFLISKLNATTDDVTAHQTYVNLAQDAVHVINTLLKDLPDDLTVTTHICRGNFKSTYLFSGSYDDVADYLGELNYDGLFLEYDNERAGSFTPLAKIWHHDAHKRLVLGLITSKFPELEDVETVKARIADAAKQVPLANLAISTQCGFASTEEGNILTEDQQWAKLRLVKQVADEVWDED
ncbi:MAG: vitamin B12 independent methionine synthase [Levilactobacillus sp.]|jgi:methionine synthase II (cobalamin-independent)|uniref:vitamin B12 independent methionine synthase n=1 Tax=Levilactobacillus sp. TaxID=2767919 RepID=UPI002587B7A2|nr:vitamin B12 independent methionine synthase [Levilactobacillus sp.]MCI1553504.1 vitamin B12 independent methionine synthase [Levilactobacillus sp.]MCI1597893.1 vitamin B12 independent methionine synthase [Levilactobacillus sp.]MCI1606281.1 vitamin B12 independent methionine synthase [Levilactobacillus sp.]